MPADATIGPERVEFTTSTPTSAVHAVTGWALDRGIELTGLAVARPSLEDVFLQLAGEPTGSAMSYPSPVAQLARHTRNQVRLFARTPIAVFFVILLPLIMLVLFNALFGSNTVNTGFGEWKTSQFYTGALAAFTAVSATFTSLANTVPIRATKASSSAGGGRPSGRGSCSAG